MTRASVFTFILVLSVLSAGCRSSKRDTYGVTPGNDAIKPLTDVRDATSDSAQGKDGLSGNYLRPKAVDETSAQGILRVVYFDFDRSSIRADQLADLEHNAQWLQENAGQRVLIEGHCDERGTVEYNFSLGARRANAVRDFLISRGVSPDRLMVISKGEEDPAVAGTGEEVWSQNRRAEFKFAR